MQKITPFLWFDNQAEEAMNFYASVFINSKMGKVTRYSEEASKASGKPAGSVMTGTFTINGQEFIVINGGPQFKFNMAISFVVNCENQNEIDELWTKLTADGGMEINCGWLTDKFGLSWQIVPYNMGELVGTDPKKSQRVMKAMMPMKKLDMNVLQRAFDEE
jgi:predicted 3-demethylubiquinone-9 3-methyltransferase (glyoxalase superfamily)